MKSIAYLLPVMLLLTGCVSNNEVNYLTTQVSRLNSKVSLLENDLTVIKQEMTALKEKRMVRLPTGAPTVIEPRRRSTAYESPQPSVVSESAPKAIKETNSATDSTTTVATNERDDYRLAMLAHQNGDSDRALNLLNAFLDRYPHSAYRPNALLALGHINYQLRRYLVAERPLETLLRSSPQNSLANRAAVLLKQVYLAQGKQAQLYELEDYLQHLVPTR